MRRGHFFWNRTKDSAEKLMLSKLRSRKEEDNLSQYDMRKYFSRVKRNIKILRKKPASIRKEGIIQTAFKIAAKESFSVIGRLDYSNRNILMRVDSEMQIYRLNACSKEPETVRWIESRPKGGIFYDIGANVGAYSFVALANGFTKVYAFEPSYATFASLNENVMLNGWGKKIITFCAALGSKTGMTEFSYRSLLPGEVCHSFDKTDKRISQLIPVFRLDEFIEQFHLFYPTCVKIDVDGYEREVLQGMGKTLMKKELKSIQVEISDEYKDEVFDLLTRADFSFQSNDYREGKPFVNYIFNRNET